jgi:GNAT superfamily N-acetyltransferase
MTPPRVVRIARPADADQLAAIYAVAEGATREQLGLPAPSREPLASWFTQLLGEPCTTFLLAEHAGFVQLAAPSLLQAIYVVPAWWGTGVAGELHDLAIELLRANGVDQATLAVIAGNTRARRFYERRDWKLAGRGETLDFDGMQAELVRYERAL